LKYISLHNHTEYSLLDAPVAPKEYAARAKELGMSHLAITDHGSLSGVMKFMKECKLADVNPILGCEFYMREGLVKTDKHRDHIVALARNKEGWLQLLALNKMSQSENGFYYRPRITMEQLLANCSNLTVTSACIFSPLMPFCADADLAGAEKLCRQLQEATRGHFYLEFIYNSLPQQVVYNMFLRILAEKTGIPFIVTNDVHFMKPADTVLRELVRAIMYKMPLWKLNEEPNEDIYFKTPEEIWVTASNPKYDYDTPRKMFEEGCERTLEIAGNIEQYDIRLEGGYRIPKFCQTKVEADKLVADVCWSKLAAKKFAPKCKHKREEYEERLSKELAVISEKEFSNYFLIMRDIVDFCDNKGIFVGVGRGSVVGSLTAYLLGITRLDPVVHDLMFERFLSRSRKEPPDIDMDFDSARRDEVEEYIKQKYGEENVAHVFTFGTFGTRGVIRDLGRVFELDQDYINMLTKEVKDDTNIHDEVKRFAETHRYQPAAVKFINDNETVWNLAERIRGRLRHYSMHASGVVIDDHGLTEVPMLRIKDNLVCALQEGSDEREISELGLIKFDILGLTACGILSDTIRLIKETNDGLDVTSKIDSFEFKPGNYAEIFKHFNQGDTAGVFQFSSRGIKDFMMRVGVSKFSDLVAINALYRPANLQSGEAEEYINRKKGDSPIIYLDERLEPILKGTYGCIVYQEQILQLLRAIGQFTLEEADEIRSLFKKHYALGDAAANNTTRAKMAAFKRRIMTKWKENGLDDAKAEHLFGLINHYTKYAFNKSHAAAYAYIAFQMMWLKHHYPAEFHVAALNREIGDEDKVAELIHSARFRKQHNYNIKVYSPRINKSKKNFSIQHHNIKGRDYGLREGFISLHGIGERAAEELNKVQPVIDFKDFLGRVNRRVVNKRVIAGLIKSYVFEGIPGTPVTPEDLEKFGLL